MAQVPTGTKFAIASVIAATKNVTAVTNATPAVCTCTSHGYSTGDIILFTSGWSRLHLRAFKVTSVDTNSFSIDGLDSTSTSIYPAGSGVGTAAKITTFTALNGIISANTSGGDPKNVTYQFLESDIEYNINDGFTASAMTLEIDADQLGTAGYTALTALTDVQTTTVLRQTLRSGAVSYLGCTVALNDSPVLQSGQINRVRCSVSGTNRVTRYAS